MLAPAEGDESGSCQIDQGAEGNAPSLFLLSSHLPPHLVSTLQSLSSLSSSSPDTTEPPTPPAGKGPKALPIDPSHQPPTPEIIAWRIGGRGAPGADALLSETTDEAASVVLRLRQAHALRPALLRFAIRRTSRGLPSRVARPSRRVVRRRPPHQSHQAVNRPTRRNATPLVCRLELGPKPPRALGGIIYLWLVRPLQPFTSRMVEARGGYCGARPPTVRSCCSRDVTVRCAKD